MNRKPKTSTPLTTSNPTPAPVADLYLVLKVPEFGDRYRVSHRTVERWLKVGLPHMRLGYRNLRIPVPEADRWVNEKFYRKRERA